MYNHQKIQIGNCDKVFSFSSRQIPIYPFIHTDVNQVMSNPSLFVFVVRPSPCLNELRVCESVSGCKWNVIYTFRIGMAIIWHNGPDAIRQIVL